MRSLLLRSRYARLSDNRALLLGLFFVCVVAVILLVASPAFAIGPVGTNGQQGTGTSETPRPDTSKQTFSIVMWLADLVGKAALDVLEAVIAVIIHSPEPNLKSLWFRGQYNTMLQVAMWIIVPMAFLATIGAIFKGGIKEIVRTYLFGVPVAILGGVVVIAGVTVLQDIDQNLTDAILGVSRDASGHIVRTDSGAMGHYQQFYDNVKNTANADIGTAVEAVGVRFLQLILFMALLVLTFVLWFEMIFRQIMIYVSVIFVPLALAAWIWAPLKGWLISLLELVVGMVFAKFVIAAVISFGLIAINSFMGDQAAGGTSDPTNLEGIGILLTGAILIGMACLVAPSILYFIMSPSHQILRRRDVASLTPVDPDRMYARRQALGTLKKVVGGGKGKALTG